MSPANIICFTLRNVVIIKKHNLHQVYCLLCSSQKLSNNVLSNNTAPDQTTIVQDDLSFPLTQVIHNTRDPVLCITKVQGYVFAYWNVIHFA